MRTMEYELQGVSDHHGTHMGGHYTAQFKHPISKEWWWFDDEQAQKLDYPRFSSSNYIFFFRKSNPDRVQLQPSGNLTLIGYSFSQVEI